MKTKFLLSLFATVLFMNVRISAQDAGGGRILIAYFSATGTTAAVAESLAVATGGELYAITPADPYTAADLDWTDRRSRCSEEMHDPDSRPALGGRALDTEGYDVVFIGYPIWWNLAPHVVNTFIESHDLKGRTIVPFATSGGSGIAHSVSALKTAYPTLDWREGKLLVRDDGRTLHAWVNGLSDLLGGGER